MRGDFFAENVSQKSSVPKSVVRNKRKGNRKGFHCQNMHLQYNYFIIVAFLKQRIFRKILINTWNIRPHRNKVINPFIEARNFFITLRNSFIKTCIFLITFRQLLIKPISRLAVAFVLYSYCSVL